MLMVLGGIILAGSGCCPRVAPVPSPHGAAEESATQGAVEDSTDETAAPAKTTLTGAQLYALHCAACHGQQGDGQGLAAQFVFPKPRDFRSGKFRLVSTANSVPSREDLHAVLLRGMPGSSMPPWKHLSQAERDALVDEIMRLRRDGAIESYTRSLKEDEGLTDEEIAADDVQQEILDYATRVTTPGESSVVPDIGPADKAAIARGQEVYAKFGCLQCHGKAGKGDGGQAMFDDEKYPTAPRDFTLGIFKGGHDPASLYRRIAYGMPGTPMPSSQQMTPEQMIDLVHFVRSLSTENQREAAVLNREKLVVKSVATLPNGHSDAAWAKVAATMLHMVPLWWRNSANPTLQVQAAHDAKTIAFRLSWQDATADRHAAQSQAFEDAVAVELFQGGHEPFLGMGDPRSPVDVWFWDADRESVVDVEDQYPDVVVDLYPFSESQATTPEFRRAGTELANQPPVSLPALATGNQIAPGHAATGGSSLTAGGAGSATFRLPKSQLVAANGTWADGRWTVLMTRTLGTKSASDGISLAAGAQASVAFAVWDGAAQDRDGKKLVTIWQDLVLEK
jgi:mono/diheme cytochrome c family protein